MIAEVMPDLNMDASALAVIDDLPWWEAWSADEQSCLRDGGITTRSW